MKTETVTLAIAGADVTLPARTLAALWIEKLRGETASSPTVPPAIGAVWLGQGGIYAGPIRGDAGKPDYALIVAEATVANVKWADAMKWAEALAVDGALGFTLPFRKEQAVLFGNVPELFEKEAYWSREESASFPVYAWCQYFVSGYQFSDRKGLELRARAVRRVPISQFDALII